jgi:signal peptidase I
MSDFNSKSFFDTQETPDISEELTTDVLTPLSDTKEVRITPPEEAAPPAPDENVKKERKVGWLVRDLFEWGETLVSAVVIIVVIFTFFVRVTSVDGLSMQPTLQDKDQMLVTNFFYTPKVNDIVVVYAPKLPNDYGRFGKDIIKRVIGVEGDHIRIEAAGFGEGIVYRNGDPLEIIQTPEGFLENGHYLISAPTVSQKQTLIDITIPPGHVFVLGDNRINSTDSRCESVGLVDVNHVAGRAFMRVAGSADVWGTFYNAFGFVT